MNESIIFFYQKYTLYETRVIATILTSYFKRPASNEVVHGRIGRCLEDDSLRSTWFLHENIRG